MAKTYISNAFSLNMVDVQDFALVRVKPIEKANVPSCVESVIGHPDTARVVSAELGFEVPCNRANLKLESEDRLYVAQYLGPRLPEGATKLPEGAVIKFYEITFDGGSCKGCPAVDCNNCSFMSWAHG